MKRHGYEAIVIGVSAGGMEALSKIIPALPASFPLSVAIVQHMREDSDDFLAQYLDRKSAINVCEAAPGMKMAPGTAYVAPAGYHLLIEEERTFSLTVDPRVNFARPAIDVLFETAADVYREKLVGVVLTGASADGSRGLKQIKDNGGLAVVQDPRTAEATCMPKSAIAATKVDHVLPLKKIGKFLAKFNVQ